MKTVKKMTMIKVCERKLKCNESGGVCELRSI